MCLALYGTCTTILNSSIFGQQGEHAWTNTKSGSQKKGAGCMRDVCVPDEPLVSLPVYLVVVTNKWTSLKSSLATGAFFSITVCYDLFPFLASAGFLFFSSVHLWMASISQCLHFSISHCCLPAGWLMLWFMAELLEPPQHLKHSCRNGHCLDSLEGPMQAQRCLIKDEVEMQVYMPLCAYVKDGE